jgi:hypothetical protein
VLVRVQKVHVLQLVKQFPPILWNPYVHHRVHNSQPMVPHPYSINPVHNFPPQSAQIEFNYTYIHLTLECIRGAKSTPLRIFIVGTVRMYWGFRYSGVNSTKSPSSSAAYAVINKSRACARRSVCFCSQSGGGASMGVLTKRL